MIIKKLLLIIGFICISFLAFNWLKAQSVTTFFNDLHWRMIGPHRGGRTVGATGVLQQPNVFYIGVNNGGVWKTTDFGRTWFPIFDDQATGSIGDVAVAPSNPDVIYAASGEGIQRPDLSVGDGIYKSINGGKTWVHTGLKDAQQIGGLAIDPQNENRIFVAALGHPYGPNTERGIFRTVDGGKTWEKVLYKDENTGAAQVSIDPKDPKIIYADLWAARQGPWENGSWNGPESGLFKSTDGGNTWKKLTSGLPGYKDGLGRIGFCIAPSEPSRLFATVDAGNLSGVYRSDNGGESWTRIQTDARLFGRGSDFAEIRVDPKDPDIVYTANVVTWKSIDGGKTWKDFRGAPGGDDYHRIWINPGNPDIILIASDQGAIVTVNGGQTFSSWYNQPTAQFYHVSTDNAFPYNVYGGQQESGSVGIASRGNDGEITFREWHPVGAEEYGYVAADPLDPNIIYGGKLTRYDKRTGQSQNISPASGRNSKYRFLRTAPVLFSPIDRKTLFYAGNVLFKTINGGHSWQELSPDLSRESWDVPVSVGIYTNESIIDKKRRGVIYTVAPSPLNINLIWCGTDDGLIHVTTDGGRSWKNNTPVSITPWSKISIIEAGHFNAGTAYAAVNRIRLDDMHPHIYRTDDYGGTWKEIVNGLPNDPVNVVREDPLKKGLLYAGSERSVYVSFDNGEHWNSLRLNMPATSIRDLVIKDNDLVVATHGRSFWILDDISPLRQSDIKSSTTILYKPSASYRVRWNTNTDTPLPQEEPAGENPPDGAVIDYFLQAPSDSITLEIVDDKGNLVRRFSSNDKPYGIPDVNIPLYWIRPQQILSAAAGHHRLLWDMHYTPLNVPPSYPIAAIYKNTAPVPTSPWVNPGTYHIKLSANGRTIIQPLLIKMDPRVKTSLKDLRMQHDLSMDCYRSRRLILNYLDSIHNIETELDQQIISSTGNRAEELKHYKNELENLKKGSAQPGLVQLNNTFAALHDNLQDNDMPPTSQIINAVNQALLDFQKLQSNFKSTIMPIK